MHNNISTYFSFYIKGSPFLVAIAYKVLILSNLPQHILIFTICQTRFDILLNMKMYYLNRFLYRQLT